MRALQVSHQGGMVGVVCDFDCFDVGDLKG